MINFLTDRNSFLRATKSIKTQCLNIEEKGERFDQLINDWPFSRKKRNYFPIATINLQKSIVYWENVHFSAMCTEIIYYLRWIIFFPLLFSLPLLLRHWSNNKHFKVRTLLWNKWQSGCISSFIFDFNLILCTALFITTETLWFVF